MGVLLALIGLVVAIAVTLGFYKYYWAIPTKRPPFQDMRMTKLTFNGKATSAVISPDGKQVVYVLYDGGLRSLWLRQVATGTDVKLTGVTGNRLMLATHPGCDDFLVAPEYSLILRKDLKT